jgi:hypothetical protein
VHREPESGRYKSVIAYTGAEQVAPLSAPGSIFQADSAFL